MIKLTLGKSLEERVATCNFCGEDKKECIKSSVPQEVEVEITKLGKVPVDELALQKVIDEYKFHFGFFKSYKTIENFEFKYVCDTYTFKNIGTGKTQTITEHADICKDCIKQLAKLI